MEKPEDDNVIKIGIGADDWLENPGDDEVIGVGSWLEDTAGGEDIFLLTEAGSLACLERHKGWLQTAGMMNIS